LRITEKCREPHFPSTSGKAEAVFPEKKDRIEMPLAEESDGMDSPLPHYVKFRKRHDGIMEHRRLNDSRTSEKAAFEINREDRSREHKGWSRKHA
jgi:hypothetical protein